MCDENTERDIDAALGSALTRRRFATVTAAAAVAAIMPRAKGPTAKRTATSHTRARVSMPA